MRKPKIIRNWALVVLVGASVLLVGPKAIGRPETCPVVGADAVTVTVTSPAPGSKAEGPIEVLGRFKGPSPLFQVELFVGDSRKDILDVEPKAASGSFTLTWDSSGAPEGPTTLVVVACGGEPGGGSLERGVASVPIEVLASPPRPAGPAELGEPSADDDGPGSALWVGVAMGVPGLIGLVYAIGVKPRGRKRPTDSRSVR